MNRDIPEVSPYRMLNPNNHVSEERSVREEPFLRYQYLQHNIEITKEIVYFFLAGDIDLRRIGKWQPHRESFSSGIDNELIQSGKIGVVRVIHESDPKVVTRIDRLTFSQLFC